MKYSTRDQYWSSAISAAKGDNDKSLAALDRALKLGYRDFHTLDTSPHFAKLRPDPRYQELIQQFRKQ